MSHLLTRPRKDRPRATQIAVLYVTAALAWILLSDAVAVRLTPSGGPLWVVQAVKGTLFVLLTALLLYLLIARREGQLASEHARLDLVLGQLPGLLWSTDRKLRIESISGDLRRLHLRSEDLVGQAVTALSSPQEARTVLESQHRRALAGGAADFRIDLRGKGYAVRIEPLRDEAQSIVGTLGFAVELVSAAVGSDHSLRDALRQSQVLTALGGLVQEVAHQLKNPLFALSAALEAFEARVVDDPGTARLREILHQQVKRIERIVSGLQVYSRSLELHLQECDLKELLDSSVARMRNTAAADGIELLLLVQGAPPRIRVDPDALVGTVEQVIRNALESAPRGSQVTVTLGPAVGSEGEAVEVSVLDRGPGIAPADLERVFLPLFTRRSGAGGLGLAIAERVVRAHGGHISARNRTAGGACITLWLPVI